MYQTDFIKKNRHCHPCCCIQHSNKTKAFSFFFFLSIKIKLFPSYCSWAGVWVRVIQWNHHGYLFTAWCLCLLNGSNLYPLSSVSSDTPQDHSLFSAETKQSLRRHTDSFPADSTGAAQQWAASCGSFYTCLCTSEHADACTRGDILQLSYKSFRRLEEKRSTPFKSSACRCRMNVT